MKWNVLFALFAVFTLVSCSPVAVDDDGTGEDSEDVRTIRFNLLTTRASEVADFTSIIILDIKDGEVEQVLHQQADTHEDFGTPTLTISEGDHTLHFLATDAEDVDVEKYRVVQKPMGDTFFKAVDIDGGSQAGTRRVVLERIVAKVVWQGEGNAVIGGLLNEFDLSAGEARNVPTERTVASGDSLYTLIPSDGYVTLNGEKTVAVKANTVTTVLDNDGSTEEKPEEGGGDAPPQFEVEIETNDTAIIYASTAIEIRGITLAEVPDPISTFASEMSPYRMPTRLEALTLRHYPFAYWTGDQRCLCYDDPKDDLKVGSTQYGTGNYYTFEWGSGKAPSKAGQKTAYCIIPVRSVPLTPLYRFEIDADFEWNRDSVKLLTMRKMPLLC